MNVDRNKWFPNQLVDGDPQECVAITICDIVGNIDGRQYDPDFTYAMTLRLEGVTPTTAGSDPLVGMESAVGFGLLPISLEDFSSKTMGEQYVANWQNYSTEDQKAALQYVQNGIKTIGKDFDGIANYLEKYQAGVSMPMKWYESFNNPTQGVLSFVSGANSIHNVAVYDAGPQGLLIKPWLGDNYGVGGYAWMPRTIFDQVVLTSYGFDPNAWRWISILGIIARRYPAFLSYLPAIIAKSV